MPEISLSNWNDFLSGYPDAHLLQSGEWGELKSAFGWEPVRLLEQGLGAQVLFRRLPFGFTFAYLPKGPVGLEEAGAGFWGAVDRACQARQAIFLKVERDGWAGGDPPAGPPGFLAGRQHVQPASTLLIDLDGGEEDIFNRMKPKTRYNVRLAGRKEVSVRVTDDIEKFYRVMSVTSQREAFHVHSLAYYRRAYELFHPGGMCELFVADYQGQALAALMVFARGSTAYYFYGASADVERNRKPTYPLQWEAIRWAHGRGCRYYDMWGIPDEAAQATESEEEEREDGLWGVYRFKRGFGGLIRRALPPLDRVYNPLLYKLYLWRFSGSAGTD